jgi:hypothetical protein
MARLSMDDEHEEQIPLIDIAKPFHYDEAYRQLNDTLDARDAAQTQLDTLLVAVKQVRKELARIDREVVGVRQQLKQREAATQQHDLKPAIEGGQ